MFKRGLLAVAFTLALLTAGATPAGAIPPPGDQLLVTNFYSDGGKQTLIGQTWRGCPDQSPGRWGKTSRFLDIHTVPC
jgi:hypothetical protein